MTARWIILITMANGRTRRVLNWGKVENLWKLTIAFLS